MNMSKLNSNGYEIIIINIPKHTYNRTLHTHVCVESVFNLTNKKMIHIKIAKIHI